MSTLPTSKNELRSEILSTINELRDLDTKKLELLAPIFEEFRDQIIKVKDLDTDLRDRVEAFDKNTKHMVVADKEFKQKLPQISDDSLIVYVKKAQLYKVYKSDKGVDAMLQNFQDDDNAIYSRTGKGHTYEVVRDTYPQKLMITISDNIKKDQIETIKHYLIEFLKNNSDLTDLKMSDFKVYNNENHTEFLVEGVHVQNSDERDKFVERFIRYMKQKNSDLANKILLRSSPEEIEGIRMYKLASGKSQICGNTKQSAWEHTISAVGQTHSLTLVNNGTISIVQGNNNTATVNSNNVKKINKTVIHTSDKTIGDFCRAIYNHKPEWFKENKFVDLDIIVDAYRAFFDDEESTNSVISRKLNQIIFDKSDRNAASRRKRLVKREALRAHFNE